MQQPHTIGTAPADFLWTTGIENTFVVDRRARQRSLDEYELMGHYDHWREDLSLTRELGVQALRWGPPWYRVEPQEGRFDWSWTDGVLPFIVEELGATPIVDLVHYGCPPWLDRAFDDERYPRAVAAYARAFADRYQSLVRYYTPLNEPHMTSLMCGQRGLWPPYMRGERGYIRVMTQGVLGIIRTIEAIREVDPHAVFVHVEASALHRSAHDDLASLAAEEHSRRFLSYDLLHGSIIPGHSLFPWLVRNGTRPQVLREIATHSVPVDVMGLNFYPQWSTHQLYLTPRGHVRLRATEQEGSGFAELIENYHDRFGAPVMVTETSAYGPDEVRARWLGTSVAAIKDLRGRGVPVVGYTWFPLFTMVDWRYRNGQGPVEAYHIDLGLYTQGQGNRRWNPTPLVEQFARYRRDPEEAVGPVVPPERALHAASS